MRPGPEATIYLRRVLPRWYRGARRDLPWRRNTDPYRILVSEAMLQQTRVAAVIPYYERFLAAFPDPASLAAAAPDKVLSLWAGLGYYRRARHLKKAAERITSVHGGRVPDREEDLLALPGVGRYTAGAVLSIAFGRPAPVLDGNVFRVLSRFFALPGSWSRAPDRERYWRIAEGLVPARRPGDWNQALMEWGALVCVPRSPDCARCPVRRRCRALRLGRVDRHPEPRERRPARKVRLDAVLHVDPKGRLLLERRAPGTRMEGLWELPAEPVPGAPEPRSVGSFRHAVLDEAYTVDLYVVRTAQSAPAGPSRRWVAREELAGYGLTGMARKGIALADREGAAGERGKGAKRGASGGKGKV
ncbi:MAG: A/G-specific adenine glycosylase [Candidatus Eisenbacteria bacterium]|nr:A/G-specific adenine glycosylase [Candidatus Eisenbacteria bacterium]